MPRNWLFSALRLEETEHVHIRSFAVGEALQWVKSGGRLFLKHPALWLVISIIYMAIAFALSRVPLFGVVLLALVTPFFLGGAFGAAALLANAKPRNLKQTSETFSVAGKYLFGGFADADAFFPIFQLSIIIAGLVLFAQSIVQPIAGPILLDTVQFAEMAIVQYLRFVGALAAAVGFLGVVMALLTYAVPLCVLDDAGVVGSLVYSAKAVWENLTPFIGFLAILSIPFIFVVIGILLSSAIGWAIAFGVGSVFVALAINSMFCSYKLTFRWST